MIWLVLATAVLFIVGGLLMVRPSPAQKRTALLRQAAMGRGLRVKLGQQLDLPKTMDPRDVVGYMKSRSGRERGKAGQLQLDDETGEIMFSSGCFYPPNHKLVEFIHQLPKGTSILIATPTEVALGWNERGDIQALDQVVEALDFLLNLTR